MNRRFPALVAAVVVGFALAYSFLSFTTPAKYSSPDEASNSYFASRWAEQSSLWFYDEHVLPSNKLARPRSMTVTEDLFVVPGGFIGMPVLLGSVGKLAGEHGMRFVTPLFAVLAAAAWAALAGKYLGKRAGWIAGALLLACPVWWYESSRVMQPNVAFCTFLILGAYMYFVAPLRGMLERANAEGHAILRYVDALIAGLLVAAALAIRTSEAYWIALGIAVLVIAARKSVSWMRVALFALGLVLGLLPYLFLNNTTYGHYLGSGYGNVSEVSANVATLGWGNKLLGPVGPYLFPLGFAPRTAIANAFTYLVTFFWWWTALVIASVAFFFRQRNQLSEPLRVNSRRFAWVTGTVTLWLIAFYGSYIADGGAAPSIGSSYFRYWLPLAVLFTVPLAWWFDTLISRLPEKRRVPAVAAAAAALLLASGLSVFLSPGEGLLRIRDSVNAHVADLPRIIELTSEKGLIITDTEDKYLFPDRKVLVPLRSETTYAILGKMRQFGPLYYFGITFPEKDIEHLRTVRLAPQGLDIRAVETFGEQTLYEFVPLSEAEASSEETAE